MTKIKAKIEGKKGWFMKSKVEEILETGYLLKEYRRMFSKGSD